MSKKEVKPDNFQQTLSNVCITSCGRWNSKRMPNDPRSCIICPCVGVEHMIIIKYLSHGYVTLYVKEAFADIIKVPNQLITRQGDYSGRQKN